MLPIRLLSLVIYSTCANTCAGMIDGRSHVDAFVEASFSRQTARVQGAIVPFRWRRVPQVQANRTYPAIIWFHGLDECGRDNHRQLRWIELLVGTASQPLDCEAFVLACQLPDRRARWDESASPNSPDLVTTLHQLVLQLATKEPIDVHRQYLIGLSQGTAGAWSYAARYRPHVAAQLLLAPSMNAPLMTLDQPAAPTWAFQSQADGPRAIDSTKQSIQLLHKLGTTAHFTLVDSPDHNCWTTAMQNHQAGRWLLKQPRSSARSTPWVLLAAILVSAFGALGYAKRRGNKTMRRMFSIEA